jgi:cholesterol oxidase
MGRLALPKKRMKDHYNVVVIGSGYGDGIAASRLARAGRRVCVLERGKELRPGEYPRTEVELLSQVQMDAPIKRLGSRTALFDIRFNKQINALVGCGLGGTSLINAAISLRPDPRVFSDRRWPAEIRNETGFEQYFGYAEAMLKPAHYPDAYPRLHKLAALAKSAGRLNEGCFRVPLLINFQDPESGVNQFGETQRACVGCGDCVSGCNYHAKNTVLMNYLPDAANHGAEIYTELCARHVERQGEQWRIHCQRLDADAKQGPGISLSADIVVLAAGTLGSTEILLRSREMGLPLSAILGSRFSGNGDTVGFAYNADQVINGIGLGPLVPGAMEPVGPCSTAMIDARGGRNLDDGMVMEDGAIPGALATMLPAVLAAGAKLTGIDTDRGLGDSVEEIVREGQSKLLGAYTGAIKNTLFLLIVGHDDSAGRMYLEDDRLRISWPGVGRQSQFERASEMMRRATEALGGTYVRNPVWNELTDHNLVTGHPLGGCAMADNADDGVVDHKGQVYTGAGRAVHRGLYVMDGAVIPRSLGANPLLTICALAERSCDQLARDHGWTISYALA